MQSPPFGSRSSRVEIPKDFSKPKAQRLKPSIAAKMPANEELSNLMQRCGVDPRVLQWCGANGCETVPTFANWVDARSELAAHLLDKTECKDDRAQLAALKQAWREADAATTRAIKRKAEGLSEEPADEPLDFAVYKSIEETFKKYYKWHVIDARRVAADRIVGRLRREFEAKQPNLFPLDRVRSLAAARATGPAKKQRLGDNIALEWCDEAEDKPVASDWHSRSFFEKLDILCFAWAIVGCFSHSNLQDSPRYAQWHELDKYYRDLEEKAWPLLGKFVHSSVVAYVTQVEEGIRAAAIQIVRNDQLPTWSGALLKAAQDQSQLWQDKRDILIPHRLRERVWTGASGGRGTSQGRPANQGRTGQASGNGGQSSHHSAQGHQQGGSRWATAAYSGAGKKLCKKWNDKRGCARVCPNDHQHGCDIKLANGKSCDGNHKRFEHNAKKHGEPAKR